MKVNDHFLLEIGEKASFKVGSKVISPPKPTTLSTSQEAGELRESPPTALAIGEDEVDELLVFLSCPWPFLQPYLLTTWLSSHFALLINSRERY